MIDIISDEPPIEFDDRAVVNLVTPHLAWFLCAVGVQLILLFALAANKVYSFSPVTKLKIAANPNYLQHDRFRGSYLDGFSCNVAMPYAPRAHSDGFAVFTNGGETFCRLQADNVALSPGEVALKVAVGSGRPRVVSVKTSGPFFVSEKMAETLRTCYDSHTPVELELSVNKSGNATIIGAHPNHVQSGKVKPI